MASPFASSFSTAVASRLSTKPGLGSHNKINMASTPSTTRSSHTVPAPSARSKGKRGHAEAFAEERKAEADALASLGRDKHARKMEEYEYKRRKLDYVLQKENHQREREKEAHELCRLQLCLSADFARVSGSSAGSTSSTLRPMQDEFGGIFGNATPLGSFGGNFHDMEFPSFDVGGPTDNLGLFGIQ